MKQQNRIPALLVEQEKAGVVATAALSLVSIVKRDLFGGMEPSNETVNQTKNPDPAPNQEFLLHRRREGFIQALATWPRDTVVELRLAARPSLTSCARGRLDVFLLVRAIADSKAEARARVLDRFLQLRPLVSTFITEAEFSVVQDEAVIQRALTPFAQTHARAVTRKTDRIRLSVPETQQTAGFGNTVKRDEISGNCLEYCFPWRPAGNDWSMVCTALMQQMDPFAIIVRLRPSADGADQRRQLADDIRTCEWFLRTGISNQVTLERRTGVLRDALIKQRAGLENPGLDLGVFITGPRPVDDSLANVLAGAITEPCHGRDGRQLYEGGSHHQEVSVCQALAVDCFPESSPFNVSEAAAAFRLPSPPDSDLTGLPVARYRTALALVRGESSRAAGAIHLCNNAHQGVSQPIVLGPEDRMRHVFVLGQTGTGKSTLMENMIMQDIANGQGVGVIDPHGDLVSSLVGRIPESRLQDVVYLDVLDWDYPFGMNILKWDTPQERDLLIDELYLTMDRIYDLKSTGGPAFEANFRGMIKLLMGSEPRKGFVPTILDFPLCFVSKKFREWLRETMPNKGDMDFLEQLDRVTWTDGWTLANLAPYITSKFNRFLNDQTIRRIVGQETCLDFEKIMNEGKILLLNLGKGRFGHVISAILANHMVARFKLAAMKRGHLPPEKRPDFFLYVDECHNLPSENFCELLSEARKYRLGLVLATQYAAQLNKSATGEDSLLSAIFGNVGTKLTFRLGPEDARLIAPMLYPVFSSLDLTGLSNWKGYVHTQINNDVTPPFSFSFDKITTPFDPARAKTVQEMSRSRYGRHKDEVEREIALRRQTWQEE